MQTVLMDLKDQMLNAIHQIDELLCEGVVIQHTEQGGDNSDEAEFEEDPDDEEQLSVTGIMEPAKAGHKKQKPIQYDLAPRRRDVAFKEHA